MTKKLTFILLMLLLAFSGLYAEEYEQKIGKSFNLPASGSIELENINGEIEIMTRSGGSVDIKAIKKSDRKGDIENVEVIFEQDNGKLRVKTKYNERHSRAKVDFTVSVPERLARAVFKSINGPIKCAGKFADLTLKTINGKIDFSGEFANAGFEAVNGAIELSQEPLLSGDLKVESVNGPIDIELNRKSAFEIEGQTVNGSIDNEFGVEVKRHLVGRSMRGKVNGGGYKVNVETVNGSIDISKI